MRVQDWETKLAETVARHASLPFGWGTHDCATFCANCVEAITGADPLGQHRGSWSTAKQAIQALRAAGGLRRALDARFRQVPVAFARRGDIVLFAAAKERAIGICDGAQSLFVAAAGGLAARPTLACRAAWRVD